MPLLRVWLRMPKSRAGGAIPSEQAAMLEEDLSERAWRLRIVSLDACGGSTRCIDRFLGFERYLKKIAAGYVASTLKADEIQLTIWTEYTTELLALLRVST